MKIRRGFVTNSSSSSFVIAIRDDATQEDIYNELFKLVDLEDIEEWVSREWVEAETVKEIMHEVAEELYNCHMCGMALAGWHIVSREYNNEDNDVGIFMYDNMDVCEQETEHMKIEGGYY